MAERAWQLIEEMRPRLGACEKSKQLEKALELLEELRQKGLEPNMITFSAAIRACEKAKQ